MVLLRWAVILHVECSRSLLGTVCTQGFSGELQLSFTVDFGYNLIFLLRIRITHKMAATARQERELKMKCKEQLRHQKDLTPIELLRAFVLAKGVTGIKTISR